MTAENDTISLSIPISRYSDVPKKLELWRQLHSIRDGQEFLVSMKLKWHSE